MTPLALAQNMAASTNPEHRAMAVAMVARGLSETDPSDPLRQPWSVETSLPAAARYLGLDPAPELLDRARVLMPALSDALLNRGPGEWCLHCGSATCEHAARHNAAYGRSAQ